MKTEYMITNDLEQVLKTARHWIDYKRTDVKLAVGWLYNTSKGLWYRNDVIQYQFAIYGWIYCSLIGQSGGSNHFGHVGCEQQHYFCTVSTEDVIMYPLQWQKLVKHSHRCNCYFSTDKVCSMKNWVTQCNQEHWKWKKRFWIRKCTIILFHLNVSVKKCCQNMMPWIRREKVHK